jgi:hypothetical protein
VGTSALTLVLLVEQPSTGFVADVIMASEIIRTPNTQLQLVRLIPLSTSWVSLVNVIFKQHLIHQVHIS